MMKGASNLEELHALCTSTFLKRRLKKDVLEQLPPKMRQQVGHHPPATLRQPSIGSPQRNAALALPPPLQIYLQLGEKEFAMLKPVQKQLEEVKMVLKQLKLTGEDPAGAKNEEKRLLNEFYILSARAKARDGPMRIFTELGPLL